MFDHTQYRPTPAIKMANRQWPNQVIKHAPIWCAVDLRDGNQALVEPMNVTQKQTMWQLLIDMGFKQIEVGFPSASQADFDFVRWLIDEQQIPKDVTIQVLVQARDALIERTFEALKGVKQAIVHIYNSTSPTQRDKVFNLDKQGIKHIAVAGAKKVQQESQNYPKTHWSFEYSPESFSNTEVDYAVEICDAVMAVWQPTEQHKAIINLPATVENAMPNVFADQVESFCQQIKQRQNIIISIHTHNDRGCAVAAAELAILAGADRIEGTLMGNGERTGNMDIITMAMNLYSQGIDPQLDLSDASRITNTVQECTQIATHPRHPWVGELVYTAFSGSHQDAIKKCLAVQKNGAKWDVAYLPINPQDLGRDYQSVIRINSQSGKGGVAYILENEFGITMPRWGQIAMSQAVQTFSEINQREVSAQDIKTIFENTFMHSNSPYRLGNYQLTADAQTTSGAQERFQANLKSAHESITIEATGNGTIAAFCNALSQRFGVELDIIQYDQITQGCHTDAPALAFVQVKVDGQKFIASAQQQDSLGASLSAILSTLNQHISWQNKRV
jgi:2-isopropylmalate synthase